MIIELIMLVCAIGLFYIGYCFLCLIYQLIRIYAEMGLIRAKKKKVKYG